MFRDEQYILKNKSTYLNLYATHSLIKVRAQAIRQFMFGERGQNELSQTFHKQVENYLFSPTVALEYKL